MTGITSGSSCWRRDSRMGRPERRARAGRRTGAGPIVHDRGALADRPRAGSDSRPPPGARGTIRRSGAGHSHRRVAAMSFCAVTPMATAPSRDSSTASTSSASSSSLARPSPPASTPRTTTTTARSRDSWMVSSCSTSSSCRGARPHPRPDPTCVARSHRGYSGLPGPDLPLAHV